jgi:uncharacterized protein
MSESAKGKGMLCPVCGVVLVMSERHGIEIDYCPTCRGVWLDRGELDKIIERAAAEDRMPVTSSAQPSQGAIQPPTQSPWTAPGAYKGYDHDGP